MMPRQAFKTALVPALCVVLALTTAASAYVRVAPEGDVPFEYASRGWADMGPVAPSSRLQVSFALRQGNPAGLQAELEAVSSPAHPRYGMYLTKKQVTRLTAAPDAAVAAVKDFVTTFAGPTARTWMNVHRDFLHVEMPAEAAGAMFGVSMHRFVPASDPTGATYMRAHQHYTLPSNIASVVDFVGGLNRLPDLNRVGVAADFAGAAAALAGTASLPAGNTTIVAQTFGGADQLVFVLPRCGDGSVMTEFNSCSFSRMELASVKVTIAPNDPSLGVGASSTYTAVTAAGHCQACSKFNGEPAFGNTLYQICNSTAGVTKPDYAIWCALPVTGAIVAANSSVTAEATFADGSSSGPNTFHTFIEPLVTPAYIRNLYQVGAAGTGVSANPGTQSVAEFLKQYYSPADLKDYFGHFGITTGDVTLVGPNTPTQPGGEASLDIQVIKGVAPNVPTTFWSTAGLRNNSAAPANDNQEPFLRWITDVLDQDSPPLVHSSSYSDREDVMPRAFTDRLNVEFIKAGSRGLTLLFATGDDGAAGIICRTGNCSTFNPTFPPTSPTVTSVGGTQMGRPIAFVPPTEVVADSATGSFITSGGAFSNRYAMPAYQAFDVKQYLSQVQPLPPASLFNASGRAYPDISAISTNFLIYMGGSQMPIGGTSASTPTSAALFSMLNQVRMDAGWPVLGFMNPLLYTLNLSPIPYFNDIEVGNNKCSALPNHCAEYGFYAWNGWDACTGLGSPAFGLLRSGIIPAVGPFTKTVTPGTPFTISTVNMYAPDAIWGPDVMTIVRMTGTAHKKVVSGDVAIKVYEDGVSNSVYSSAANYFECNSHGCDPEDPVALKLEDPTAVPTSFALQFSFRMPPLQSTGCFRVEVFGKDQNQDSDFIVELGYNFTKSA